MNRTLLILIAAFLLLGCVNRSTHNDEIIIATLKGPSAMGMIKIIDSLSLGENHNVHVKILNEPIQVRKMVIEGTADFAILPTTMASILYNKGLAYKLVAIPVWGTLYLCGKDSTILEWNHLKGKRVNIMGKGMTPDVMFRFLLKENNITPEVDVALDYRFPTHIELANAMAAEQVELGVISEPMVSLLTQRNSETRVIFDLNEEWNKVLDVQVAQTALIVKSKLLVDNKLLVDRILHSYSYSTHWVNQNADSAAKLIVKHNIMPTVEAAIQSIPRSNLNFKMINEVRGGVESYLRVFYRMNPEIIGGEMPDEGFYQE